MGRKRKPTTEGFAETTEASFDPVSHLDVEPSADIEVSAEDYMIARLAWEEGLAPNTILARLNWERSAQNFTKVRRSLQKAVRRGLLQFRPPAETALQHKMKAAFPWLDQAHVERDHQAACLRAARLIAAEIERFWSGESGKSHMVIANAGGSTLRDVVDALQRVASPLGERPGKHLVFLSLNAAEASNHFDQCANFLSVRMSQIYRTPTTRHFAVVKSWNKPTEDEYDEKRQDIDLLISSAGSRDGFLADCLGIERRPDRIDFVGDLAFHLIDATGRPARVPEDLTKDIEDKLGRRPDWHDLVRSFNQNRTLLVLTGGKKLDVGRALFRSGLPKHVVLDVDVASHLVGPDRP